MVVRVKTAWPLFLLRWISPTVFILSRSVTLMGSFGWGCACNAGANRISPARTENGSLMCQFVHSTYEIFGTSAGRAVAISGRSRVCRGSAGAADAFVEGPGVVFINEGQQTGQEEQVDELALQVVPLLDR